MVQRERSGFETFILLMKGYGSIFLMPIFFILACVFTSSYSDSIPTDASAGHWKWALLFWVLFLGPIIIRLRTVKRRKHTIKHIASLIEGPNYGPQKGNIITEGWQVYLGVDAIRGTILYINMTREGVYDVVGLDMDAGSWTRVERIGKKVKLYTKIPECPSLEISAPGGENDALKIYDVLCAMQHRVYEYKTPFPQFVKKTADSQHLDVHLNAFI